MGCGHPHSVRVGELGSLVLLACLHGALARAQPAPSTSQATTPPATQPASQPALWLRVTAGQVHVRSRPDANSVPVAQVERNTLLHGIDRDQYGWYRILPPERVFSYVSAEHVDRRGPEEGIVSVRSGTLRVRVGSAVQTLDPLQSEVQTLLRQGARVRIVGEDGTWLKIVPPAGVYVYVSAEHVEPVSDEVAARLRPAGEVTTRPRPVVAASRPTSGPDLSGPWGQRLLLVETAIDSENRKPPLEQNWSNLIVRLRPITTQREEPMVAQLSQAWIAQLEQRIVELDTVRQAEDVLRRAARDETQHQHELARIERARQQAHSQPAFAAEGVLLRSYAVVEPGRPGAYLLQDPLTGRTRAYVEIPAGSDLTPATLLGQYVGVSGARRSDAQLGADVVQANRIVVLTRPESTTRPARQPR